MIKRKGYATARDSSRGQKFPSWRKSFDFNTAYRAKDFLVLNPRRRQKIGKPTPWTAKIHAIAMIKTEADSAI